MLSIFHVNITDVSFCHCCSSLSVWWIIVWQLHHKRLTWRKPALWKWRNWLWWPCWSALCVLSSWTCQLRCCPVSTLSACRACRSTRQPSHRPRSSARTVALPSPPGRWRSFLQTSCWCDSWRGFRAHPGPAGTGRELATLFLLLWERGNSNWITSRVRSVAASHLCKWNIKYLCIPLMTDFHTAFAIFFSVDYLRTLGLHFRKANIASRSRTTYWLIISWEGTPKWV